MYGLGFGDSRSSFGVVLLRSLGFEGFGVGGRDGSSGRIGRLIFCSDSLAVVPTGMRCLEFSSGRFRWRCIFCYML
jgi:hypothetical protein